MLKISEGIPAVGSEGRESQCETVMGSGERVELSPLGPRGFFGGQRVRWIQIPEGPSCFCFSFTILDKVKVIQLCPTLCDLMDYTVHGIFQARILEW